MRVRGSLATIGLLGALGGCAAPAEEEKPPEEARAEDEPLDIAVDSVDIAHGALRVRATMVDGSADVSVRLGGDCEPREVGGGLSTPSTLVWSLGDRDVADAIRCGLVVRARGRDRAHYVNKVAELAVAIDLAADEQETAEDGPQLQAVTVSEVGVTMAFAAVARGARLSTGDGLVEAAPPDSDEPDPAESDDSSRFAVPGTDFARSVLRGRRLRLDGSSFVISLSVGGTALQRESPGSDEPQANPAESAPDEPDDGE
jgi:hypothetical protein